MLREIISRCKTIKYCADNFTQDFGLDLLKYFYNQTKEKNETIFEIGRVEPKFQVEISHP